MKREVYLHVWRSYGDLPMLWVGVALEFVRVFGQRIATIIFFAQATTYVAAHDVRLATRTTVLLFVVYFVATLLGAGGELLAVWSTDKRYERLLVAYHERLISKDLAFYRNEETGAQASLFRQHLDGTVAIVRLLRGDAIRLSIVLLFPPMILVLVNWPGGLLLAAIALAQAAYLSWASDQARALRKQAQNIYQRLNAEVTDELTNIVALKSDTLEEQAQNRISAFAREEAITFWRRHKLTLLLDVPRAILIGFGLAGGCLVVLARGHNPGNFVFVVTLTFSYALQMMNAAGESPDLIQRLDEHINRVSATLRILGRDNETIQDRAPSLDSKIAFGAIHINDVSFSYKTTNGPVLVFAHLNLTIASGEHVGVVGRSGAGKSTLATLLMRFADVDSGGVAIDGVDVRDIRQRDLRSGIAYAPQEALLFHRSIKDNIRLFCRNATDEAIINAAISACAHGFISALPNGYDTVVGDRGATLSGGERQRIILARTILKPSKILILDESTSAVDLQTEALIQRNFPAILGARTAIVISHRLSAVTSMDRILVLDEGRVVEEGSHAALLASGRHYRALWESSERTAAPLPSRTKDGDPVR